MDHKLELKTFGPDHHVLWMSTTKIAPGGYHFCDEKSSEEDTIIVCDGVGGPTCKLFMRRSDFYLVGFANERDQGFGFDREASSGRRPLSMPSTYTQLERTAGHEEINRYTLRHAVRSFASYRGEDWCRLQAPFLAMTLAVSESLRFASIFERMRAIAGGGARTKFSLWVPIVRTWKRETAKLTAAPYLEQRPGQYDLRTWRSFERRSRGPGVE
jgi:hypothetical protein